MEKGEKKLNLLIITQAVDKNDSNLGFFHEWVKEFSKRAGEVRIIALRVGEVDKFDNVKIFSMKKDRGAGRLRRLFLFQKYLFMNLGKVDGVFVHMCPEYVIAAGPLVKLFRKKMIHWYTHKSVTNRLKLAEKLADKVLTASKESYRLPSKKLEVTGHGINLNNFEFRPNEINPQYLRLLSVGRISPTKDVETSVRALKKLRDKGIGATLDVVGEPYLDKDKVYFEALKTMVENMGLENYVRFLGKISNEEMPRIYHSHNILLHSSTTGSMDKVVLEALACGIYVVSSSEAFRDLGEEFVWRANDDETLVKRIEYILKEKPNIKSLSNRVTEKNNLERLITHILLLY